MSFNQILTRVLVHDPNPLLAETISTVLERRGAFTTRASSGEIVAAAQAFRPNVIVMDPGHLLKSPEVLRAEVAEHLPQCEMLAYVDVGNSVLALKCIAAGFVGAVSQSRGIEVLIEALNTAKLGGVYIDTCLSTQVVTASGGSMAGESQTGKPLSSRERHVLEQVARGFSNKEIARGIGLSPKTVETHRARGAAKLGLQRKSEIVHYALQNAWLSDQVQSV